MDTPLNHHKLLASSIYREAEQSFQRLESRIQATETRLHGLLATLPQLVWFAASDGAITYFNQRWYEYTGLTAQESLGWEFLQALHPEDRYWFVQAKGAEGELSASVPPIPDPTLEVATATPIPGFGQMPYNTIQCRIRGADGTYRWFEGQRTPIHKEGGEVLEWVATYTLLTQPQQALAPLEPEHSTGSSFVEPPASRSMELASQRTINKPQPTHSWGSKQATYNTTALAQQNRPKVVNKLKLSQAIIWEAEPTTEQFTFVSQSAERLLGYPVQQWLNESDFWVSLLHPEDRQWTVALCRKKMSQGRDYEVEYRCIAADRRVVWLRDRACVVRDRQGQIYKRRGLMVDITLAKQAQDTLQTHSQYSVILAQLSQHLLASTDLATWMDTAVTLIAQTLGVEYCQILQLCPDGKALKLITGMGWHDKHLNTFIPATPKTPAGATLHSRQPVVIKDLHRETRFQQLAVLRDHNIVSGMSVMIQAASQSEDKGNGEDSADARPFGVFGVYTSRRRQFSQSDVAFLQAVANLLALAIGHQHREQHLSQVITQLQQTQDALDKRNAELEQFVYVASHDLKAPLRAIANLSQWIEEDISEQLNAENLQQMQLLRGRVHRLEGLIDGLLQYSRAGRLPAKPEPVDVTELLAQIIETLAPPPQFTIEVGAGMPTLVTERFLLEQVFTHLIDNGIKHHPDDTGTVKISVQDHGNVYEFAVADDGAGIALRFQERIFGIFQTLQARDEVENTGVGLAIVKRIVDSKGGIIRLSSQEGQGATFYFTWPKS